MGEKRQKQPWQWPKQSALHIGGRHLMLYFNIQRTEKLAQRCANSYLYKCPFITCINCINCDTFILIPQTKLDRMGSTTTRTKGRVVFLFLITKKQD